MASEVSKLVKDLSTVPSIVGSLGLSIAAAQKAFNLDYIENIERLLVVAKNITDPTFAANEKDQKENFEQMQGFLKQMIVSLAPSRYQFTETTLKVKMDLAQTMTKSEQVGFGVNTGAVAVNAAMTSASGYDAQSAAEVTTVIHAIPADKSIFNNLLDQSNRISDKVLELPPAATIDENIVQASSNVFKHLVGKKPKLPTQKPQSGSGGQS